MATANIPYSTPPARPQRRHKPSDDRIAALVAYEASSNGERGSCNRVAAMLGVSDDTIRRAVKRVQDRERVLAEEQAAGLQYVPPPGGYRAPEPVAPDELARRLLDVNLPQTAAKQPHAGGNAAELLMSSGERTEALNSASSAAIGQQTPQANAADRRTLELGETPHAAGDMPQTDLDVPAIPPHPQDPAQLPTFPPAPEGSVPIGPAPSPEMEPRPPVTPHSPSSPDDLPETHPLGQVILPGRDFFYGAEVPQQPEDEPEDDDPDSSPIPPAGPAGPLPAPPPALPPDDEPPRPPAPSPLWVGSTPIVVRQVVRVPVEQQPTGGLISWLTEHEAARKQLLAVAVFLLLMLLSWVG